MPPFISRHVAFAAKVEATPGVAETVDFAADAIRLLGAAEPEDVYLAENLTDDVETGKLGVVLFAAPSGRAQRFRCRAPIAGAGAAYSASVKPEIAAILRAIGFSEAIDTTLGAEKATYTLSDTVVSLSCALQMSNRLYKIFGAKVESAQIVASAGGFPVLEFTVVGAMVDPTNQAFSAPTYDNVAFPIWRGAASLAIGGHTGTVVGRSLSLNFGLEVAARSDANSDDAHAGYETVRRVPTFNVVAEAPAVADWNPHADIENRTARAMSATFGKLKAGTSAYETVKLDIAECRAMAPVSDQNDNGIRVFSVNYRVGIPAGGGAEVTMTFSD